MHDFGDLYHLEAEQLENLVVTPHEPRSERAVPRKLGQGRTQRGRADRAQPGRTTCRAWSTPSASGTSARRRRRRSRGTCGHASHPGCAARGAADHPRTSAPSFAASVRTFADEPHNRALVAKLAAAGVNMESRSPRPTSGAGRALAGKTFVFTGTLPTMTREEATNAIEELGGKGLGLRQQEDQLRGGRRRRRHEAGKGPDN